MRACTPPGCFLAIQVVVKYHVLIEVRLLSTPGRVLQPPFYGLRPFSVAPANRVRASVHRPQLAGKTDQRFVEASFKLLRDCLGVKTVLTPAQFLAQVRHHDPSVDMHAYRRCHNPDDGYQPVPTFCPCVWYHAWHG